MGKISVDCGHCFCGECLTRVLLSSNNCPECRREIAKENFVGIGDFLKRFNPEAFAEFERQEAELKELAKPPVVKSVKQQEEEEEMAVDGYATEMPELKELYADVMEYDDLFVPSTKIHRVMTIIKETGKERSGCAYNTGFLDIT